MAKRGPKPNFCLKAADRKLLKKFTSSGKAKAREYLRAQVLLMLDQKLSGREIQRRFGYAETSITRIRKKYEKGDLDNALFDNPRTGRPNKITPKQRAKITALACTKAPDGRGRWTLSLLKEQVIELKFVESISRSHLARILKKTK